MNHNVHSFGKVKILLHVAFVCTMLLVTIPGEVDAIEKKNMPLEKDEHDYYSVGFTDADEELRVEFSLDEGTAVDVYIMTSDEYSNYHSDRPFTASFSQENTTGFDEKWTQPTDEDYYLVIDNKDNAHSNDAVPTGKVVYDIRSDEDWDEMEDFLEALGLTVLICCGLIVVLVLIIIVLLVKRRKGDTVVRIAGTPPPTASYPGQAPNVPPPAYQPPPPQPYPQESPNEPPPPPQMPPAVPAPMPQQPPQQYQQSSPLPMPVQQQDKYPPSNVQPAGQYPSQQHGTPQQGQRKPPDEPRY